MAFLSAVYQVLRGDGSNPIPLASDGTRPPITIILGDGLSATGDARGRLTLTATSGFSGTITDAQHGGRGRTLDGLPGGTPLHALASSTHPGFLSAEYATNLGFYTGQVAPVSVGQFGIAATGAGPTWVDTSLASPRLALPAGVAWDGSFELFNGAIATAAAGSTVTLPTTNPYLTGAEWRAFIDNVDGAANITITCPAGTWIAGVFETDYVVAPGSYVEIRPAANVNQDRWAVSVWTV